VKGWFSGRLELKREKSVLLAGKKWASFRKPFQFVWIAFDQERRTSNLSLKMLIVAPGNHFDWRIPHREVGLESPARSVSINVKFQKKGGVIAG
jgi:hypothetical protein